MKDELLAYRASANCVPISLLPPEGKRDGLAVRGGGLGARPGEVPAAWNQVQSPFPEKPVCVGLCR